MDISYLIFNKLLRYIVDGIWRFDPNEHYEKNNYDEFDNVIEVFPAMYEVGTDIEDSDS